MKTAMILRPGTLKTTRCMTTPRQIGISFQPCPSGRPRLPIELVLPVAKPNLIYGPAVFRKMRMTGLGELVCLNLSGLAVGQVPRAIMGVRAHPSYLQCRPRRAI